MLQFDLDKLNSFISVHCTCTLFSIYISVVDWEISCLFVHCRLRLFQKFDQFRILVCGGDGSMGWVLSEIDRMDLHRQVSDALWVGCYRR
jgi:hypothetical protein